MGGDAAARVGWAWEIDMGHFLFWGAFIDSSSRGTV